MLHKKQILAVFLILAILAGMVPQNVLAVSEGTDTPDSDLEYTISEAVNEDKTKSEITLEVVENKGNILQEIILPDGTVVSAEESRQESDGVIKYVVHYTADENGIVNFRLKYASETEAEKNTLKPVVSSATPADADKPSAEKPDEDKPPAEKPDEEHPEVEEKPEVASPAVSDTEAPSESFDALSTVLNTIFPTITAYAAEMEPENAEKTMTVPFYVRNLKRTVAPENEDYISGTAGVQSLEIKQADGESGIISSSGSMGLSVTLQLQMKSGSDGTKPPTAVWVGYRFVLPQHTPSGGTWGFQDNSYGWLLDKDNPSTGAKPVADGSGSLILEGVTLLRDKGDPVIPGSSERAITVTNQGGVEGEEATLTGKAWLVADGEDAGQEGERKITVSSNPEFDLCKNLNEALFSAYVNTATGDFSLTDPGAAGYSYGRIYGVSSTVWPMQTGTEKLDPTKPITWDMSYKVLKKEGAAAETEESNPNFKPVLLGIRRNGGAEFTDNKLYSEMSGTLLGDMTMSGNVRRLFLDHNGLYNTPFYKGGAYSFAGGSGTVRTSVVLSGDNKNSGYNAAESVAVFFVPLDPADSDDTTRKLVVKLSNLSATSYSGKAVADVKEDGANTAELDVPRLLDGSGKGLFSRRIYDVNGFKVMKVGRQSRLQAELQAREPGTLVDYYVNAVNILVKVEAGFELLNKDTNPSVNGYTGTSTVLWAVKPDGRDWTDEVEFNHTKDWELRYFDDFADAKAYGTVVGVLLELRGGLWSSDQKLSFQPQYEVAGTSGKPYAAVQDISIWRGKRILTEADSYSGTNGGPVSKFAVESTDMMVPYDNPANDSSADESEKVYRKDTWNSITGTAEQVEGLAWGFTMFPKGGAVSCNKATTGPLNGNAIQNQHGAWNQTWRISTYDIAKGERYADRTYGFTVSGAGNTPLNLKAVLDAKNYYADTNYKVRPTSVVYLSTADTLVIYTPGATPGERGSFSGGRVIDINNFTVPGDGEYQLYYTSFIGNAIDLADDAKVGVYWNESKIDAVGESNLRVDTKNSISAIVTNVIKSSITGTRKSVINPAAISEVGYNLTMNASAQVLNNIYLLDVLPFNGDGRGTDFHGTYALKDGKVSLKISADTGAPGSHMRLYYTTDENIRTVGTDGSYAKADIFAGRLVGDLGDSFTAGSSSFRLAAENADGTWSVNDGDVPTAILVCGTLNRNEQLAVTLQLKTEGNKRGDKYVNASNAAANEYKAPIDSNAATVTVAGRDISGKAWLDKDENGLYGKTDTLLDHVVVKLHRADGSLIEADADGSPYGNVKTISGSYIFKNVPENADGYYVTFTGDSDFDISRYKVTQKYAGGAVVPQTSESDSDVESPAGLPLVLAQTDVFTMLDDAGLVAAAMTMQQYKGINVGLIFRAGSLSIRKELQAPSTDHTQFDFLVHLTDRDGGALAGSYPYEKSDGTSKTVADGGSFTLKGGEKVLIKDLPTGTNYRVEEIPNPNYRATWANETGQIGDSSAKEAVCTNLGLYDVTFLLKDYGAFESPTDPSHPRKVKIRADYNQSTSVPQLDLKVNPEREILYWVDESGNQVNVPDIKIDRNRTFTAIFKEKVFTVRFIGKRDRVIKTELVKYGRSAKPPADDEDVKNKRFVGWSKRYTNITRDTDLYALFMKNNSYPQGNNDHTEGGPGEKKEEIITQQPAILPDPVDKEPVFTEKPMGIPKTEDTEKTGNIPKKPDSPPKYDVGEADGNKPSGDQNSSDVVVEAVVENPVHKHCILHFLLLAVAVLEGIYYWFKRRKDKKRLDSLRDKVNNDSTGGEI